LVIVLVCFDDDKKKTIKSNSFWLSFVPKVGPSKGKEGATVTALSGGHHNLNLNLNLKLKKPK
jgi:hypothetical protein